MMIQDLARDAADELHVSDLVDEMEWEDHTDFLTLEEAGLEEHTEKQPSHGYQSVHDYIAWFSDGEDSRYEMY